MVYAENVLASDVQEALMFLRFSERVWGDRPVHTVIVHARTNCVKQRATELQGECLEINLDR